MNGNDFNNTKERRMSAIFWAAILAIITGIIMVWTVIVAESKLSEKHKNETKDERGTTYSGYDSTCIAYVV